MARVSSGRTTERERALEALRAEGLFVIEWTDSPGVEYPRHAHASREVRWVLKGTMTVCGHPLGPGDRIDLDPDEPHEARVGPDGVRYLAGTQQW